MAEVSIEEFNKICREFSSKYGVNTEIHPNDFIFRYILNSKMDIRLAISEFHDSGIKGVMQLRKLIVDILDVPDNSLSILDFASGYGRLTRYLNKYIPNLRVTSCDIHDEANVFNNQYFGTDAISSTFTPEDFKPKSRYDLIFVYSLFTHLPRSTWERWLISLYQCLIPGGTLIITTHGVEVLKRWGESSTDPDGYLWKPITEQFDISLENYGGVVSLPTYVIPKIMALENAQITFFSEAWFDSLQDVYAIKKLIR